MPAIAISLDGLANDGRPGEGDDVTSIERSDAHVSGTWVLSDAAEDLHVFANVDGGRSTVFAGGGNDRIVGEDEADPSLGTLSYVSPVAQALMGKPVGESAQAGASEATIVEIS